ncbi:MAG: S8 family peptidase [Bacteroidales bacterium]|nr:S8 family peptidase [Lachnoclostridium sp.]MCM1383013.1 S8 family peptidase [Lachnoclostridium sp.]MCM1463932.1 S8 family peptidase [Bacteroidales bacterium]
MQRVRNQIEVPYLPEPDINKIYTGEGVTAAVLDTGVGRHPDLAGRVYAFRDFVNDRQDMYDDSGHGTHVCGIICGSGSVSGGRFRGIAPRANLVVGKVLDGKGNGCTEHMLQGLQWVLKMRQQYHIRILNISVGIGELQSKEKEKAIKNELERVYDSGIIVICAAGNKGPESGSISSLGASRRFITVGCHDGDYYKDYPGRCDSYSGRGDAMSTLRKPDIVAPGTNIVSCNVFYNRNRGRILNAYVSKSGTSMATPIVSGVAALALEKNPFLTGEEFRKKLTATATDLGEEWNKQGWGMVNVRRLLKNC